MNRFISTEQITKYHPDKYADQISDAIVTECLKRDENAHVACETMVKDNTVVLGGEITCGGLMPPTTEDYEKIVHRVANKLNYKVDKIINLIGTQSPEINKAVIAPEKLGAGDQGMMYGYAVKGPEYLPYGFYIANKLTKSIEAQVGKGIFKGDAKVQVTTNGPSLIDTILISACHEEDVEVGLVREELYKIIKAQIGQAADNIHLLLNPSGSWTLGGPTADCGLTGRKIVCDQYGGYAPVGGGAFSGKDPTKVDRSAAYMARKIAVDCVKEFQVGEVLIQLAYAIGVPRPVSVNVTTTASEDMSSYIQDWIIKNYDLTPAGIIKALNLYHLDYEKISEGCHMNSPELGFF